ncbi:hypothetical protein Tco_1374907, partial [Tanacetum coccineum]
MALPAQNINHSAFRSMFEREKLLPIPPALPANSTAKVLAQWNAVYDAHNEVACLMLGSTTPELHRQFENSLPYEMLQDLKSMEFDCWSSKVDLLLIAHSKLKIMYSFPDDCALDKAEQ